jgi:hypothetical protein
MVTNLDLSDEEDLSRFARLYGETVQRLVASGLQFLRPGRSRAGGALRPREGGEPPVSTSERLGSRSS